MKYLSILLVIVLLGGCGYLDDPNIYPQTYETAIETCKNNEGVAFFEYDDEISGIIYSDDELHVYCKDGSVYTFEFSYDASSDGWEEDHTWEKVLN